MAYVAKWMKNDDWIFEQNGKVLNMMELTRHLCLKVDWNKIVDEAETHARRVGKFHGKRWNANVNNEMKWFWERTEKFGKQGLLKKTPNVMRFTKGSGGCHYHNGTVEVGLRKDMSMGWVVETLFHELSHKAHHHYVTPVINGKRRPHDWLFNRIMLGAMNEVMKKKTHELNPYAWGWSIGAGYAPTKKANDIMTELFITLEKLPKKYAKFVQDAPIVEPKPEPTEEEILKKQMGGFRRTLTSCLKGMQNYDGYNEVMDDSWNIADGEEYILNLFDRIRPTMSIKEAGLDENEIVVLEWFIIEQQEVWFEFDAWRYEYSDSAFEKKSKRLHDLWDFLNR
jgi:hypothetical protein